MARIAYDPVKDRFSGWISGSRFLRRLFYFALDLLFLRSWHLRKKLRELGSPLDRDRSRWSLLDAGSGFGQYDRFILRRFKNVQVLSVDVKEDYIRSCRHYFRRDIEAGRVRFQVKDLLEPMEEEAHDLILCIDVLEHIEDDITVIRNMKQALKPDGWLLIHSPSHRSGDDAEPEEGSFVGEHARTGYSAEDIAEKFWKAGLEVEETRYTYGLAGHLSWRLTIQLPMLLLNRIGMAGILLLLLYYPFVLPFTLLLNLLDLYTPNRRGHGIMAVGRRPTH